MSTINFQTSPLLCIFQSDEDPDELQEAKKNTMMNEDIEEKEKSKDETKVHSHAPLFNYFLREKNANNDQKILNIVSPGNAFLVISGNKCPNSEIAR